MGAFSRHVDHSVVIPMNWRWVPNALTVARIGLTLGTFPVALAGARGPFVALVLGAVLTDLLDGPIARATGAASKFGAQFDSAADFVFYVSIPAWAWILIPDVVTAYAPALAAFSLLYVASLVVSSLRRSSIAYHNRWSRATGTYGVAFFLYSILFGASEVLFLGLVMVASVDVWVRFAMSFGWPDGRPRASE